MMYFPLSLFNLSTCNMVMATDTAMYPCSFYCQPWTQDATLVSPCFFRLQLHQNAYLVWERQYSADLLLKNEDDHKYCIITSSF